MPTAKECRYNAEICLKLADETREIYAKNALIELAEEFRALARHLEHSSKSLYHDLLGNPGRKNHQIEGCWPGQARAYSAERASSHSAPPTAR